MEKNIYEIEMDDPEFLTLGATEVQTKVYQKAIKTYTRES